MEGKEKPPKALIKFNGRLVYNELDPNFVLDLEAPPPKLITTISESPTNQSDDATSETSSDDFVPGLRDELKDEEDTVIDCIKVDANSTNANDTETNSTMPICDSETTGSVRKRKRTDVFWKPIICVLNRMR